MNKILNTLPRVDRAIHASFTPVLTNEYIHRWLEYGSYVDERRRVLYVETPKAACSSIKHMLRTFVASEPLTFNPCKRETRLAMLIHDRDQMPIPPLTAFSGERLQQIMTGPGWFRFCVIRHPYDRFFSAWRDKVFITEPGFEAYTSTDDRKFVEFADFVARVVTDENPFNCDPHWRAQVSLLLPDDIAYSRVYDLTSVADLPADLERHLKAIGIHDRLWPLQRINQSWSIPADGFLTTDVMAKLRQFYRADFDRFGFVEREEVKTSPSRAVSWVSEFSDAVFDRNLLIAEQSRCAQAAQDEIRRLSGEKRDLSEKLAEAQTMAAAREQLAAELERAQEGFRQRDADAAAAQDEIRRLSGEKRDLSEKLAEAQTMAAAREQLAAELERALQQLEASRSWRMTWPLRALIWRWRQIKGERHLPATKARDHDAAVASVPQTTGAGNGTVLNAVPLRPEVRKLCIPSERAFPDLRVVIITPDIHGPIRNGGIGTAFAALAQQMAGWGADITVAYALGKHSEGEPVSHWQKHYAELGVRFLALDKTQLEMDQGLTLDAPHPRQLPWRVYRWLERNESSFDLAIFPEWMGLAYYALIAKGQGLAFNNLVIAVNTHSPESWATEGNRALPTNMDFIDRDFMEREAVRRADWVISPSGYMIDWMRSRKWEVPDRLRVIQNLMPDTVGTTAGGALTLAQKPTTIVFFGRLELRKGLKLFCDAIDRLPAARRGELQAIRFLGKAVAQPGGFNSLDYIAERTRGWGVRVDVVTDKNKDQALTELSQPGVLAVIASLSENSPYTVLECLHHGVRFVATNVGGIPELVHPNHAASCLFAPTPQALVNSLENAMTHGTSPARMARPQSGTKEQWQNWFQEVAQARSAEALQAEGGAGVLTEKPLVSICLVHYNRPQYLEQSLASIREQSYSNIEVVLVDDGSPSAEAQQFLDNLEPEFCTRGWQIIRQTNSYLGAARNRAAEAARGQYLMFMDDDNIAMPHEVETFVSAALHSGADILTCAIAPFADNPEKEPSRIWLPLGGAAGAGMYRNAFGDANAFWKRSVFLKVGGYTTDYGVGHEDWELFAEAVLTGATLEVVPKALFWYRVSANGMLRSGDIWADHARSARAYLRHDPNGLGMASAYAVLLQKAKEHDAGRSVIVGEVHKRRIWRALRMANEPSLRAQFIGVWRHQGLREATKRALVKANR